MLNENNLHEYQKKLIQAADNIPHLGGFLDMGLGKSITFLTIVAKKGGKTLILAPKAVAKNVWQQEAYKWEHTKNLKFSIVLGTPKERLKALYTESDVYVTNFENVDWLFSQKNLPNWGNLIVDESSRVKNPSSKRWKALKQVLPTFAHRYILTGTPTPKSYLDLWTQVGILDLGQRLGKSMTRYKETHFMPDQRDRRTGVVWSWKLLPGSKEKVDAQIGDICYSLRAEDYLKMPQRQDIYHTIAWSNKSVYNELKKTMVVEIEGETLTAPTAGVLTGKLLQVCAGNAYNEDKEVTHIHNDKLDFLEDLIDEDKPTIIFFNFKHSQKRLLERLPAAVVLDPDDTTTITKWRNGTIPLLLCHPKSVGIGLNLQCNVGDTAQIIWFDLPWSSEDYLQANARLFRQGQTKPVIIHHLMMEKSIDEEVVQVLGGKIEMQEALMNALKVK